MSWRLKQTSTAWNLAYAVTQLCDPLVLADAPFTFPCYDMASAAGDFVADGEVNILDLGLLLRMERLPSLRMEERFMTILGAAEQVKASAY